LISKTKKWKPNSKLSPSINSKAVSLLGLRCSSEEVIGMEYDFSGAFAKTQIAVGQKLHVNGTMFLGLNDLTKLHLAEMGRKFHQLGLNIMLLHLEWRKYFS
jgi:hypothetical protein